MMMRWTGSLVLCLCVVCVDAGVGRVEVTVDAPSSSHSKADSVSDSEKLSVSVNQQSDELWVVQYTALVPGPHTVDVHFAGQPVNHSPFTVHVKPSQSLSLPVYMFVCLSISLFVCLCKKHRNLLTRSYCNFLLI